MNMLALGHKGVNKLALICTPLYYIETCYSRVAQVKPKILMAIWHTWCHSIIVEVPWTKWTRSIANTTRHRS